MNQLQQILERAGVTQYGIIDTRDIHFSQEVRHMCEVNTCRQYGKTWCCPPALGTVEECQARICQYDRMLVFNVKYDLEDSFDFEGMQEGMARFKETCREIDAAFKPLIERYLMVANEGCGLCKQCTYPNAPCRFPDKAHGSLEGYGIFVNELAGTAGINYINGANTVTYFGGLACDSAALQRLLDTEAV